MAFCSLSSLSPYHFHPPAPLSDLHPSQTSRPSLSPPYFSSNNLTSYFNKNKKKKPLDRHSLNILRLHLKNFFLLVMVEELSLFPPQAIPVLSPTVDHFLWRSSLSSRLFPTDISLYLSTLFLRASSSLSLQPFFHPHSLFPLITANFLKNPICVHCLHFSCQHSANYSQPHPSTESPRAPLLPKPLCTLLFPSYLSTKQHLTLCIPSSFSNIVFFGSFIFSQAGAGKGQWEDHVFKSFCLPL